MSRSILYDSDKRISKFKEFRELYDLKKSIIVISIKSAPCMNKKILIFGIYIGFAIAKEFALNNYDVVLISAKILEENQLLNSLSGSIFLIKYMIFQICPR